MITAEVQIHGYRKGHQLLASSVILPKDDQAVVDRLSDVAGPLRPKEEFSPYLSTYPLPSGSHYVIARTWQDLTVSRAGCVMTKSVLIDAEVWSRKAPLVSIMSLLSSAELPAVTDAVRIELDEECEEWLPPAPDFRANELLEALFLEDAKPVVVFDAPEPELIASRLLIALWPDLRRRFALSTFALSPRKISGRDLDLVFAPSNAKGKFSDWPGRRVDGRMAKTDRHRWTGTIVRRVFDEPVPKLLSDREIDLLGKRDADGTAALRVALLWEDLLDKLDRTPTAALGLLDIANSGLVSNAMAVEALEPRLAEATRKAARSLSVTDAWDYVGAIVRKMQGHDMPAARMAVGELAAKLAERAPDLAIGLMQQQDPNGAIDALVPSIALGLGKGAAPQVEQTLIEAPSDTIARLVSQGGALASRVAQDDGLIAKMGVVLVEVDQELASKASTMLLPFLVEDRQLPVASPIFDRLDPQEIAAELCWLRSANAFRAEQLSAALINRAREAGAVPAVRDVLLDSEATVQRDTLLEQTVDPIGTDLLWILEEKRLSEKTSTALLVSILRRADDGELDELLFTPEIGGRIVQRLPDDAFDILMRLALLDRLPINTYISVLQSVLPKVDDAHRFEIAQRAIETCLRTRFDGDEMGVLSMLLSILGSQLDGAKVIRSGLGWSDEAAVASRNLVVFENTAEPVRARIVQAVDEIARTLQRRVLDLGQEANDACARLMFDAERTAYAALFEAAGQLIPTLLRARSQPISLMVAVLFPIIYRELAKPDDVPNLFRFVPFYDWDRCKAARRELVDAFMSSSWNPGDLALTACRCGDVVRILRRVARSFGGEEYLARIEHDLGRLNDDGQHAVQRAIAEIRSTRPATFDW